MTERVEIRVDVDFFVETTFLVMVTGGLQQQDPFADNFPHVEAKRYPTDVVTFVAEQPARRRSRTKNFMFEQRRSLDVVR
jgi:hypothetical protein